MTSLRLASAFGGVFSVLPTDPASIFVILLMVVAFVLVLWYGRPRGGKGGKPA
jgi:ABC-type Mn2+/Zn2+ transport system permease subunit